MKFLASAVAFLPLLNASIVPVAMPKREAGLPCVYDLNASAEWTGDDVVSILKDLLASGEIEIVTGKKALAARNAPSLSCTKAAAVTCGLSGAGVFATCMWAAIARGKSLKDNTKCGGSLTALGVNIPFTCRTCTGPGLGSSYSAIETLPARTRVDGTIVRQASRGADRVAY